MSNVIRKADQFKPVIIDIMESAESPMKRFVIHYILWSKGLSGYPPKDGGAFQCALDELVGEGKLTANKTARGTTYEKVTLKKVA